MKTKTFIFSNLTLSVMITAVVVALYAFMATSVSASTIPSIDLTIKNSSNTTITTAPLGTVVKANASVSSTSGPVALGTVDFSMYPNTSCSGTATNQNGVLLASGVAESATTSLTNTGISYKVFYAGQGDVYASTTSNCVSLQSTSSGVSVSSTVSNNNVTQGASVFQTATLTGLTSNATGTVSYGVYTNNACTLDKVSIGVKNVSNGVVANSDSMVLNTVGTFYFRADYSGDQFNNSAVGPCQSVAVNASSTNPTPTPVGPGTISGNVFNDLNRNFTKDSGENGIANVSVKLYDRSVWWNWKVRWNTNTNSKTVTTDANGNYSFTGLTDGIYAVEEIIPTGWKQTSSDFRWVLILNGKSVTGLNFANVEKSNSGNATTTPVRNDDDDHKNKGKEKKELKREEQKQKKINKLEERIRKIKDR